MGGASANHGTRRCCLRRARIPVSDVAAENEPHVSARPRKQGNFSDIAVYADHILGDRVTVVGIGCRKSCSGIISCSDQQLARHHGIYAALLMRRQALWTQLPAHDRQENNRRHLVWSFSFCPFLPYVFSPHSQSALTNLDTTQPR